MPRVTIRNSEEVPFGAFPSIAGVSAKGDIQTKAVVDAPEQPLTCWLHRLAPGAEMRWSKPPVAHGIVVWQGSIEAGGKTYGEEGAAVVEHLGEALLRAGGEGATLAHFHRTPGHPEKPARSGGHARFFDRDGIFSFDKRPQGGNAVTLYSDSGAETNDVWLHRSGSVAGRKLPPHCHSEDELIFITHGSMQVGRNLLQPGTVLAIDQDTTYMFAAGDDGLTFVNFRSCQPYYIPVGPQGKGEPRNERESLRSMATAPAQ